MLPLKNMNNGTCLHDNNCCYIYNDIENPIPKDRNGEMSVFILVWL